MTTQVTASPPGPAAGPGALVVPAIIRGELVTGDLVPFTTSQSAFLAPDPTRLLGRLPLGDPARQRDLQALTTSDIIDFLAELGPLLDPARNELLGEALAHAAAWSDMTDPLLRSAFGQLPGQFDRGTLERIVEATIGARYLDGWQQAGSAAIRAFGVRAVHIVAGNSPIIAAITIVRNALTRGDAIVKAPSNDPLTALAIARTMAAMAPDHPLTRHLSVAYWKGGDESFESRLYRPEHVERIVAWGGLAGVRHVTRYLQPGLDLVTLDPKLSATVIGPEAFTDGATMAKTAELAAVDVGALNQLGCFNARVIYVVTGTDAAGITLADRWGALLYDAVQRLPAQVSTPARHFDPELSADLRALRSGGSDWFRVIGGRHDEGAVIVSRTDDPVDFHPALSGRVANVVPIAVAADAVRGMNAYTQTVGVYPDRLKEELRDLVALHGTQRLVSLGYATHFRPDLPQDAIEPMRRMVKWIVDETYDPARTHPLGHLHPDPPPWDTEEPP